MPVFNLLCDEMDTPQTTLLLRTEIRWVSRVKLLVKSFSFPSEIYSLFMDHPFYLSRGVVNLSL
jgi:hypothetical protein